ncbi:MAG: hypothetical protein R3F48_11240 [Candidatus Zixiibacteriota bacterium]
MSLSDQTRDSAIIFLYTEIGRGHPSYLDGIVRKMKSDYPHAKFSITNVFDLSRGLSLQAWKFVRFLYRFGSRGGIITSLYTSLRKILGGNSRDGVLVKLLGRDLRASFTCYKGIVVVAHPLLADILGPQNKVMYQHGEFAVPEEAIPRRCHKIFVPDEAAANIFLSQDIPEAIVCITGQCIDDRIAASAAAAYEARIQRFHDKKPLTAGLFTSGATPGPHIQILLSAAKALSRANHRIFLFTSLSKVFFARARTFFKTTGITYSVYPDMSQPVCLIHCQSREEEDAVCAEIFSSLDFFIAPAHERAHWSVGLGLPQLLCCPHIGTFSPLNASRVLDQGVGIEIRTSRDAEKLDDLINELQQTGRLTEMAKKGYHPDSLNGFAVCAEHIFTSAAKLPET